MAVVGINSEDSAPVAISFRNPFLVGHVIFDIFDAGLLMNNLSKDIQGSISVEESTVI